MEWKTVISKLKYESKHVPNGCLRHYYSMIVYLDEYTSSLIQVEWFEKYSWDTLVINVKDPKTK